MNSWPDAAMTPFRNEKNSNWEGAYRVPAMVKWPGHIKAGTVCNDIVSHLDWMPTLLAAAVGRWSTWATAAWRSASCPNPA
jgi:arylsulfatase